VNVKRRPSTFDLGANGNLDPRYKREDLRIRNRIFGIVCCRYAPRRVIMLVLELQHAAEKSVPALLPLLNLAAIACQHPCF
jgi:hypothetical protein